MAFSSETSLLILILVSAFTSSQLQELPNLTIPNSTNLCNRCDPISTDCANTSGSFYCKCKPGFAPSLQCHETLDLGLTDGRIQDDSIVVSTYEDGYTKEMLRLDSNGGWCATTTKPGSSYVVIDLKISTIVKGFKTTTVLRDDGNVAYASAIRIQYFDDIIDELTDYLSANGTLVEFRLNDPPIIPTYLALPSPITTRYLKFIIYGYVERPCLKLEVMGCTNVQCLDIDECSANNGDCDQICTNDLGGRTCSCEDGFEMVGGDSNKTCLPIECAALTPPENGVLTPAKENYQFGDLVEIKCNTDYAPSASNPILCTSNKTWNGTTTCYPNNANQTIDATPRIYEQPAKCGPFDCTQKYLSAYISGAAAAFVVLLMVTIMIVWMICSRAKKITSIDLSLPDYHASNFALAPSLYDDVQCDSRESTYPHYFDGANDGWDKTTSYVERYIRGLQTSTNTSADSAGPAEEDLYTRLKKHAYNGSLREEFVVHI